MTARRSAPAASTWPSPCSARPSCCSVSCCSRPQLQRQRADPRRRGGASTIAVVRRGAWLHGRGLRAQDRRTGAGAPLDPLTPTQQRRSAHRAEQYSRRRRRDRLIRFLPFDSTMPARQRPWWCSGSAPPSTAWRSASRRPVRNFMLASSSISQNPHDHRPARHGPRRRETAGRARYHLLCRRPPRCWRRALLLAVRRYSHDLRAAPDPTLLLSGMLALKFSKISLTAARWPSRGSRRRSATASSACSPNVSADQARTFSCCVSYSAWHQTAQPPTA